MRKKHKDAGRIIKGMKLSRAKALVLLLVLMLIFSSYGSVSVMAEIDDASPDKAYIEETQDDPENPEEGDQDPGEEDPDAADNTEAAPENAVLDEMTETDEASGLPLINSELPSRQVRNLLGTSSVEFSDIPVMYMDEHGDAYTHVDCIKITEDQSGSVLGTADWATWYYVPSGEDISWDARTSVAGAVTVILCNGAKLEATKGITVADGTSLTIYQQPEEDGVSVGVIEAKIPLGSSDPGTGAAGIGGANGEDAGDITINGGEITAYGSGDAAGGSGGAGIGGAASRNAGNVTINYGTVRAIGGGAASGIGGGALRYGTVTINGGTVNAYSQKKGVNGAAGNGNGAGIGGGGGTDAALSYDGTGSVYINGGEVHAFSYGNGAAIGGGGSDSNDAGAGEHISVIGGSVSASAEGNGAGIGGGGTGSASKSGGSAGYISITGGTIEAASDPGTGIGGGWNTAEYNKSSGNLTLDWSDKNDHADGLPEITSSGYECSVAYADSERKFRKRGGSMAGLSTAQIEAFSVSTTILPGGGSIDRVKYIDVQQKEQTCSDYFLMSEYIGGAATHKEPVINDKNGIRYVDEDFLTLEAGWYFVDEDIDYDDARLMVAGSDEVHIILGNDTALELSKGIDVCKGRDGDDFGSLFIYQQPASEGESPGSLTAKGDYEDSSVRSLNAGIGGRGNANGDRYGDSGNITIAGGIINAQGGSNAAGIGGGHSANQTGTIRITGGSVTASSGCLAGYGAGIGSGAHGNGGTIEITGGVVTANGNTYGAGIGTGGTNSTGIRGTGRVCTGGSITISGGNVTATGGAGGAGIGGSGAKDTDANIKSGSIVISGGEVTASGGTNAAGIGGGNRGSCEAVTITGGKVIASGGGTGIGSGSSASGGSLTLDWSNTKDPSNGLPEVKASAYALNTISYTSQSRPFSEKGTTAALSESQISALPANTAIVPFDRSSGAGVRYINVTVDPVTHKVSKSSAYCDSYRIVSNDDKTWGDDPIDETDPNGSKHSWYVVSGEVTMDDIVKVRGDINLILTNGCRLNFTRISVHDGTDGIPAGSLTVYAQSEDPDEMGVMFSDTGYEYGGRYRCSIGGVMESETASVETQNLCGDLTFNGGKVEVYSCIGYGRSSIGSSDSVIRFNGGIVHSHMNTYEAGIGGSYTGGFYRIEINGGEISVTPDGHMYQEGQTFMPYSAGIGHGCGQRTSNPNNGKGVIEIWGGKVYSESVFGAGIGGSSGTNNDHYGASAEKILIHGGEVTAVSSGSWKAAGIGGGAISNGNGRTAGRIEIDGGVVKAVSASGAGIGAGGSSTAGNLYLDWQNSDASTGLPRITSTGASKGYQLSVSYIDSHSFQDLRNPGTALQISDFSTLNGKTIIPVESDPVKYVDAERNSDNSVSLTEKECSTYAVINSSMDDLTTIGTVGNTTWYVVKESTKLSGRFTVLGDVHLILCNDTALDASSGGIAVNGNAENSLTIYQQPDKEGEQAGSLTAKAVNLTGDAGIGGDNNIAAGTITIDGGSIYAVGARGSEDNTGAAAIGSGNGTAAGEITIYHGTVRAMNNELWDSNGQRGAGIGSSGILTGSNRANSCIIKIYGGDVTAMGGPSSGGIGGGECYQGGTIEIYGGNITAGNYNGGGAGIGGGYRGSGGNITISGGKINATGSALNSSSAAGIGGGYGAAGGVISISGGDITANSTNGACGIGGSQADQTATINLDWTKKTFDSTRITADKYNGTVTFVKPYVLESNSKLAKLSNIDGVTIVPGFGIDMTLKEGRLYEEFSSEVTEITVPVKSGLTAMMDLSDVNKASTGLDYAITDYRIKFSKKLPKDSLLTLTVIGGTNEAPEYTHYYAVTGKEESEVSLASFAGYKKRGERFKPSSADRKYLLSVEFPDGTEASDYQDVEITMAARYEDSTGKIKTQTLMDECRFSLIDGNGVLVEIPGSITSTNMTVQPSGSKNLEGRKVYYVAKLTDLSEDTAGYKSDGYGQYPGNTRIRLHIIDRYTAVYELGTYGELSLGDIYQYLRVNQFSEDASYDQQFALYIESEEGDTGYNVLGNLASNKIDTVFTYTNVTPRLSATTSHTHLIAASDDGSGTESVTYRVTHSGTVKTHVEKQTALHTFSTIKDYPSYGSGGMHTRTLTAGIPRKKGVYRICFTIDGFNGPNMNDNVYDTFIVE